MDKGTQIRVWEGMGHGLGLKEISREDAWKSVEKWRGEYEGLDKQHSHWYKAWGSRLFWASGVWFGWIEGAAWGMARSGVGKVERGQLTKGSLHEAYD